MFGGWGGVGGVVCVKYKSREIYDDVLIKIVSSLIAFLESIEFNYILLTDCISKPLPLLKSAKI